MNAPSSPIPFTKFSLSTLYSYKCSISINEPEKKMVLPINEPCDLENFWNQVFIWNVESQPNRNAILGVKNYCRPDLVLTGHQDNAEFAFAMGHSEPFVFSGVDQGDVKSPRYGASYPKPSAEGPTVQARDSVFMGQWTSGCI
ncbi:hypothetical protein FXO38_34924 [Capsicum annuum]|nr:hypothetical protein FXO38_34924 [Capsicum annuum]